MTSKSVFKRSILLFLGILFLVFQFQSANAKTQYEGDCKWACFYPDTTRQNILQFAKAWAKKDTQFLYKVLKHLRSPSIKRSEFFLYLSTIESLTNFWLGVSPDPEEYSPYFDQEPYNAPDKFSEKKLLLDYLDNCIYDILLFKRYPEKNFLRFDYILITAWSRDSLSVYQIMMMKDSIYKEVAFKEYNNNFEVLVLPSFAVDYTTNFNFNNKNTLAIENILDSLNNRNTNSKDFFQLSFEIFQYLNLDIQQLPRLSIYPFELINSVEYTHYRKNWLNFLTVYFYSPYKFKYFEKGKAQSIYNLLNSNQELSKKSIEKVIKKHFKS